MRYSVQTDGECAWRIQDDKEGRTLLATFDNIKDCERCCNALNKCESIQTLTDVFSGKREISTSLSNKD